MFTAIVVKILRTFPNQTQKIPMVPVEDVKLKKDVLVENSVQRTNISLYYPLEAKQNRLPVYINFHGGAFIMNNKEMDDPYCRFLCNKAACVVLNVDYAKAPEYPFPKPIEQGYEIIQWLKRNAHELNIDAEKIMVGGQSSGANIAAALCLYLKEMGDSQPLLQVLSCPMLDFVTAHADKPEPYRWRSRYPQFANFINKCYLTGKDQARHPLASPICAEISEHLAPALILIAENDAFRPEAECFVEKLKAAGVAVQDELFKGCFHAFTHIGPKERAKEAWVLIGTNIQKTIEDVERG